MMYILDRIEENIAVIYDEKDNRINIDTSLIEGRIRDGVVLDFVEGKYVVNEYETELRYNKARNRLNRLFNK